MEFRSSGIYRYHGVPAHIFGGLMGAGSHGRYFSHYVRDKYSHSRIG
ncbi:KTSC domain-containing protein [Pseudonocardia charpentierae]